jgi:hypothetical protein
MVLTVSPGASEGFTTDSCDKESGTCTYTPVDCPDPSVCEFGVCLPETGACGGQIKSGYCRIDGVCKLQGAVPEDNNCLVCNPAFTTSAWTPNSGILCDDGSTCTFSDACTSTGECGGKALPGCCDSDDDCQTGSDPCIVSKCNKNTQLCFGQPKAECCKDGLCCDLTTNTVKPLGGTCSDQVLDVQFQCGGGDVLTRKRYPGCDGTSKDACNSAIEAWSQWVILADCGTGTVCNDPGTGVQPTCVAAGTCNGACGGQSGNGTCDCSPSCLTTGTCCTDYKAFCGCTSGECCDLTNKIFVPAGSSCGSDLTQYQCAGNILQTRTGLAACTGDGQCDGAATVWGSWGFFQDCSGNICTITAGGNGGQCKPIPAGSCNGKCGGIGTGGCFCDSICVGLGDCCTDYAFHGCNNVQNCGDLSPNKYGSCFGACGGPADFGSCWCDPACGTIGDCCPDKMVCGCP